jgi:hypothetical protein
MSGGQAVVSFPQRLLDVSGSVVGRGTYLVFGIDGLIHPVLLVQLGSEGLGLFTKLFQFGGCRLHSSA